MRHIQPPCKGPGRIEVVLEVSSHKCMGQTAQGTRRGTRDGVWEPLVDTWRQDYIRRDGDHVVTG